MHAADLISKYINLRKCALIYLGFWKFNLAFSMSIASEK